MSTQQEIARRLKVSQMTVSRALRGKGKVNPMLRARILAEAERQGYVLNQFARNFARGKTGRVGIIIPDKESFQNRYFNGVLVGLADAGKKAGVGLIFINMSQLLNESDVRAALRGADGFVVRRSQFMEPHVSRLVEALDSMGKPYVSVQGNRSEDGPFVAVNDFLGATRAVNYLAGLGHRCIAFHGGRQNPAALERLQGYLQTLRSHGLPVREDYVSGTTEPDEGCFLDHLWSLPPPARPTALFVWSDLVAINVLHEAAVRGVRVPADLSVVGFSDYAIYPTLFRPHLTTLHVPAAEVGERAIEVVLNPPPNPGNLRELLEPTLTVRESTAPPAAWDAGEGKRIK
jgi:LacI family transcriptional regulator